MDSMIETALESVREVADKLDDGDGFDATDLHEVQTMADLANAAEAMLVELANFGIEPGMSAADYVARVTAYRSERADEELQMALADSLSMAVREGLI